MTKRFNISFYLVVALKLLAAIAGTELLIMVVAGWLNVERWLTPMQFDFVDTFILGVSASFVTFYWVVKPLKAASKTIGEYKQLEEILRASERQYRNLFGNNPQPMWIYDRETLSILAVNDAAVDHYGYSREEFLAMTVKDLYRPEDHPAVVEAISRIRGEIRRPGIWRQKKKDGTLIDVDVVTHDLVFNGRHARHVLINDVTRQREAEEILKESEERYRLLFYNSPIGIFNYDTRLRITECNENFADLVKAGREELIGLDMNKFSDTGVLTAVREILEGREGFYEGSYWAKTIPAGIWISMHTAPLFDRDNKVEGGVGIVEDITKRKKSEDELAEHDRQMSLGAEVGAALTRSMDLREALQLCAESMVKNLDAAFARIWTLNEMENVLELQASAGMYTHINGPHGRVPVGKFKIGLIAQEKKPHLTNEVTGDPRIGDPEWAKRKGMVAFAGYPLTVADKLVGVMAMFSKRPLRDATLTAMAAVADEIALGIERTRTNEALNESENRYRTLAEAAQDVIFVINREDKVEYINSYGADLFGLTPAEIIGSSRKTMFPDMTEAQRSEMRDVFETGLPHYAEYKNRLKRGELWLGTLLVPMRDRQGEMIAVMGISRDISERKRAEEQIRQQFQRLSALHSIDTAIGSSLDIRLTLDIFLEQVMSQLQVDAASVLLLKPHTKLLEFAAHRGFRTQALKHTLIRLGQGNAGLAALKRSIVHIPDVRSDEAFNRAPLLADEQFVSYYGVPLIAKGEVKGVLEIFHRSPLHPDQGWQDFLESLALQAAIAIDNAALFEKLERSNLDLVVAYDSTIEGWSRALDYRDRETEGHSQRVTELTLTVCQAMGMTDRDLTYVRWGALLHDIGKLGVPDNILFKPGKLDEEEWKIMKRHPVLAYELLEPIRYLGPAVDIPYCHHEKWDGTGYPRGLKGEQIPLAARIFSIVDVWDALGSDRPYRPAWPKEKIFQYLNDQTGKDFDPKVTEIFIKLLGEQAQVVNSFDLSVKE